MQTVDRSLPSVVMPPQAGAGQPCQGLRDMRKIVITPVIPRHAPLPSRESIQNAEDGGQAEAHPS